MNKDFLNIDQSPEELSEIHGTRDYYWYLRDTAYVQQVLQPIAGVMVSDGVLSCLDIGCGEGLLHPLVEPIIHYQGFDGSETAVQRARGYGRRVTLGRFESPESLEFSRDCFDALLFTNILEVLVKPEHRVALIRQYIDRFNPEFIIVTDLERLDNGPLNDEFQLIDYWPINIEGLDIQEAKKYRKTMVYRCC